MLHPDPLSLHLQGPLPRRGGLPTPVRPWRRAYQELAPVGHVHAAHEAWDFDFINHCLQWGGITLLQSHRLNIKERPYYILPHFSHEEEGLTLHTGPSDAAGADGLALMTGLAIESEKTIRAINASADAQMALETLCALESTKWQQLSQSPEATQLIDLLQALSLGATERYVYWKTKETPTLDFVSWLTNSQRPWYLFSGHTRRIWDGISPLPTLFSKELLALSGNAQDIFQGLDVLKTHHPQIHQERIATETSAGIQCFGEVIGVDTALLNIQHAHPSFRPALKKLSTQKARLLVLPPCHWGLKEVQKMSFAPLRHCVLLQGLSHQLEIQQSTAIDDLRNRRQTLLPSSSQAGAHLKMLPSLGFLPHQASGYFTNHMPTHEKGTLEKVPHVRFAPIGLKNALLNASAQSLEDCAYDNKRS